MLRTLALVCLMQTLLGGASWACQGQSGKVIFEDDFSDDSGGWNLTPPYTVIKPPALLIGAFNKSVSTVSVENYSFHAKDADYCLVFKLPAAPAPDNSWALGLIFWGKDYANLYSLTVFQNGNVNLFRKEDGKWSPTVYTALNVPSFKSGALAENSIRVVAKDQKLNLYLNDVKLKTIRAQAPDGNAVFGIYAQLDKDPSPAVVAPVQVTDFKVTAAE